MRGSKEVSERWARWACLGVLWVGCRVEVPPPGDGGGGGGGTAFGGTQAEDGGIAATGPDAGSPQLTAQEQFLLQLPADSWYVAPQTKLRSVCPASSVGVSGVMGCAAVVSAWSGGAYDDVHRQMLVWGGGHNDYWGNEVYAFDLKTFAWRRLTEPSPPPFNIDPLLDGQPASRHTYDGLQVAADAGMLAVGGSIATGGASSNVTWGFDTSTNTWAQLNPDGPGTYSLASAYDPKTHAFLVRTSQALFSFDVAGRSWTQVANFGNAHLWPRYAVYGDKRGVLDTSRRLFWSFGSNDYLVWDLEGRQAVTEDWVTTGGADYSNEQRLLAYPAQVFRSGGGDIHNASAPGVDYDPKTDQLVAWKGGGPWVLDLKTKAWTQKGAGPAPAQQQALGTYGRWRYVPSYNVFVLVNSVDEDVLFYKHSAGGP